MRVEPKEKEPIIGQAMESVMRMVALVLAFASVFFFFFKIIFF